MRDVRLRLPTPTHTLNRHPTEQQHFGPPLPPPRAIVPPLPAAALLMFSRLACASMQTVKQIARLGSASFSGRTAVPFARPSLGEPRPHPHPDRFWLGLCSRHAPTHQTRLAGAPRRMTYGGSGGGLKGGAGGGGSGGPRSTHVGAGGEGPSGGNGRSGSLWDKYLELLETQPVRV